VIVEVLEVGGGNVIGVVPAEPGIGDGADGEEVEGGSAAILSASRGSGSPSSTIVRSWSSLMVLGRECLQ